MDNQINARKSRKNFEVAALVLSIISIALCCCFYVSFPCGALAVIFASLSRGKDEHMSSMATAAFVIGIVGLVFSISLVVYSIIYCVVNFDSIDEILQYYSKITGMDYEEVRSMIYK